MDTIEISLILNNIDISKLQILREDISSLISPFGYRFIDIIEFSRKGNLVLKISYPRYNMTKKIKTVLGGNRDE